MEVQQLTEISEKIYGSMQALLPADIKVIESILQKESIKYGRIRTFSLEDSQEIVLLTMKQNCAILIKYLLENEIDVPEILLRALCKLVNLKSQYLAPPTEMQDAQRKKSHDLHAQIEKERTVDSLLDVLADIIFISKYKNDDLTNFLKTKRMPDEFSVNLAVAIDLDFDLESFELTVLSKKLLGPVFLNLVKSYKNSLRKLAKEKIVEIASKALDSKDKNIAFEIFYHLNEDSHRNILVNTKPESSPEYFGFVSSLIVNREDAEMAYAKLEPFFDNLAEALKMLLSFPKNEERLVQPQDETMLLFLLECVNSISKFKPDCFFKLISFFQGVLKTKISKEIKGIIYSILGKYIEERDIYISKVVECRDDVEREIKTRDFYLLPRLIKFLNAYRRREEKEKEMIDAGVISASPYITSDERDHLLGGEKHDLRILGLKSEDPATVIECLDCYIHPEALKLYSIHLRNAMINDSRVIDKLIEFQIDHNTPIEDISIINPIISHSSLRFFEYARLFKDFSFYLNGDILERISEDPINGVSWIGDCYNKEFGVFIVQNCGYFSDFLRENPEIQIDILPIYEKVLDENLGEAKIELFKGNADETPSLSVLCILDNQELLSEIFFKIFAKQLIYCKFFKPEENIEAKLLKRYVSPFYGHYIKAKAVCGIDVVSDINFMKKNMLVDEDLLGYLKIAGCYSPEDKTPSSNILLNFENKDNAFFMKNFPGASDFEKFILFFNIEHVSKEIDFILKDEVMKSLKAPNRLYLRMCILQLFRTRELDQIIKILEKNYEDKELIFRLSIHNVINGGRYFSKDLFQYGEDEILRNKVLFLLYYLSIWDKEYIREFLSKADSETSEEMKYLIEDVCKY